jgi:23S rRNA (adenine2030-N6)-methyltransferase
VLKHSVLALAIDYLKRKEAPFRVIDTHAGRGRYRLDSPEASKTEEWRAGIGRLLSRQAPALPSPLASLLGPYLEAVRAENAPGMLTHYPGSPAIAARLLRAQDTLIANEVEPDVAVKLRSDLGDARRGSIKVMTLDGWIALRALLPPPERRGVILIDPPFEAAGELERLAQGLAEGLKRFATGLFLAWYPIKEPRTTLRLAKVLAPLASAKLMSLEMLIRQPINRDLLNGCGLLIANPPFTFESELGRVGPALARILAAGPGAHCSVRWLKALRAD